MGTITTLRPSGTYASNGWSAQPSGTLHGVTSDNSDATYALWSGTGSAMVLATPAAAPPADERRHQVRLRARGQDGDAWWAVQQTSGALTANAAAQFTSSPNTITSSWGFGVPPDGSVILSAYVAGQSSGVKINELYLDVDTREAPTFTPQVLDSTGAVTTLVTDTATPRLRANALDLDGLPARQYRYWVTQGATIVWDSGTVTGTPINVATSPLPNGSYTAHFQIWTTLGFNTAYASTEQTVAFTMLVGSVPQPANPTVTPVPDSPFFTIAACAPYVGDFDGDVGWIEIERTDCDAVTTIAVLGPLATGECAEYTDYSLPRSGMGATCDHLPDPCCSSYRARVVARLNGALQISPWSDADLPDVPQGMIVMWPSTAASVPSGWNRVTALDGRYPKGIPTSSTAPGSTGGAASHTHAVSAAHSHDLTHTHTVTGNSGAATGTVSASPATAGTTTALSTHTHTVPTTNSQTVVSQTISPSISSVANDPARLEVIFVESAGTANGVPNNALALTADTVLTGWTDYANATGRFLKGAAAAGDGGTTAASAIGSHTHAIGAHTHAGTAHTHPNGTSGAASSTNAPSVGANAVLSAANHTHPVVVASSSTAALDSGGSGTSGATSLTANEPPFRNVRVRQNTSGGVSLPVGLICVWRGSLGSIPSNWKLCDGTNSTPDLRTFYPKGATSSLGATGGSLNPHNHTTPSHTHTTTGHTHTQSLTSPATASFSALATATITAVTSTHTHTAPATNSTTPTVGSSTSGTLVDTTSEPPYSEVAFVQLASLPTPPPAPDVFCLTWSDDEHLIRTEGPDGPMWAPILGRFTWDVDRPFTSATGLMGTRFVTNAPPGARNLHMTAAVESEADLIELRAILDRPLVLISPSDAAEVWAAPVASSVRIVKIGRIRQVTADFIGTGPQPGPQLADVG